MTPSPSSRVALLLVLAFAISLFLTCTVTPTEALTRHSRHTAPQPSAPTLVPHSLRISNLDVSTHPDLVVDSARPQLSWRLADEGTRGLHQTAYRLVLLTSNASGIVAIAGGDTGRVDSSRSHGVQHPASLAANTRYVVLVKYWSSTGRESGWAEAAFRTSMLDEWRAAPGQWVGSLIIPMHQLRRDFSLPNSSSITSATVCMSGIGYSTLYMNGRAVDPSRVLDPGWTTYQRRTLYTSFAVESFLQPGLNAVAVALGNGWYSQEQYMVGQQEPSYGPPRLWLWLHIEYSDGSTIDLSTDTTWQGSTGPTLHDGVYMGSVVDHRWVRPEWTSPGFNDPTSLWLNVSVLPSPLDADGVLALQTMDPIRLPPSNLHVATSGSQGNPPGVVGGDLIAQRGGIIQPIALSFGVLGYDVQGQPFDLGQNIAGWCRLNMTGKRGSSVMVRYTETMELPGPQTLTALYSDNLQNAAATEIFVFAEDDVEESFVPAFTYHGFRFLEVRGARNTITADKVECYFVHTEVTLVGNATFDNRVMDQLQHNLQWGQLANLMSIPSDCPQRDERKGWMGDAGISVDESLYNFDSGNFYPNFLNLIHDVQAADGSVPDTVPFSYGTRHADPNCQQTHTHTLAASSQLSNTDMYRTTKLTGQRGPSSCAVLCRVSPTIGGTAYPSIAWAVYDHYGDISVLQSSYQGIKAWVEFIRAEWTKGGLQSIAYSYGDWIPPAPYPQTDPHLIASFPFLKDVQTVLRVAALLNDTATVADYTALYTHLTADFNKQFYKNNTLGYADGSQAANTLALALPGVVADENVPAIVAALVANITALGHHTCGVTSISQLFPMLSIHGHHDLALKLAQQTEYPSYGWCAYHSTQQVPHQHSIISHCTHLSTHYPLSM